MNVDIENLIDLLHDIDLETTAEVLSEGVNSLDYRVLVSTLAQNLSYFVNQPLSISTTDLPSFVRDLQSVLRSLVELDSLQSDIKLDLIHFMISELQSAIMIFSRESINPVIPTDLDKPRLNNVLKELPSDYLDLPILQDVNFSIDQQKLLQEMNEILAQDYKQRKQVLLKRLDVTLHSFLWSVKGEQNRNSIITLIQQKRSLMSQEPDVTLYDMLVARMSLFESITTKTGSVPTSSALNLKRVLIGQVPDRGGRVNDRRGAAFQARDAVKPQRDQTTNKGKGRVQGGWDNKDPNNNNNEEKGKNSWKRQKGGGKHY